jgi:hypothetical protein
MQVADQRMDNISGGIIDLDAHKVRKSLIRMYVLSTGSRSAASRVVNTVHTAFYDLLYLSAGPEAFQFISLFDDCIDVWNEQDFRLAEQVSILARWSQPEEFAFMLREAPPWKPEPLTMF